MRHRNSRGMALMIVLALSVALLIMGVSYITQVRQQAMVNPNHLAAVQADFLGQGIAQIAAFKVKKLTGPFYYAMVAKNAPSPFSNPYDIYVGDACLRGNLTVPFISTYQTSMEMLASKVYKTLNFRILVSMEVTGPNNFKYQRQVEQIYNGEMSKL